VSTQPNIGKPVIAIAYKNHGEAWTEMMQDHFPMADIRNWPDWGELSEIDYAVAWRVPDGVLASCPNLKAIFSIGAGVDQLLKDPEFPKDIPLIRMVDEGLTKGMAEYAVMAVLALHRDLPAYQAQQRERRWQNLTQIQGCDRRVGIMGLGQLGGRVVEHLRPFEFQLSGWSRTRKDIDGMTCFAGLPELETFLGECDILLILLPLTEATRGLIDETAFAMLPKGACVINGARGSILNIEDARPFLQSGHLKHLWLDVHFREPLPEDHWSWGHDNITITPHIGAVTLPETASFIVAEGIKTFEATGTAPHIVDLERGY